MRHRGSPLLAGTLLVAAIAPAVAGADTGVGTAPGEESPAASGRGFGPTHRRGPERPARAGGAGTGRRGRHRRSLLPARGQRRLRRPPLRPDLLLRPGDRPPRRRQRDPRRGDADAVALRPRPPAARRQRGDGQRQARDLHARRPGAADHAEEEAAGQAALRRQRDLRRRPADDRRLADRVRLALRLRPHQRRRLHGRRAQRGLDVDPDERPPGRQGDVDDPRDGAGRPERHLQRPAAQPAHAQRRVDLRLERAVPDGELPRHRRRRQLGHPHRPHAERHPRDGRGRPDAARPSTASRAVDFFYDTTAEATDLWSQTFGPYPFDSTGAIADNANLQRPGDRLLAGDADAAAVLQRAQRPRRSPTSSPTSGSATASRCKTWPNIWLNEGFATFAQYLWDEHKGVRAPTTPSCTDYSRARPTRAFWTDQGRRPAARHDVRQRGLPPRRDDAPGAAREDRRRRRSSASCATGRPSTPTATRRPSSSSTWPSGSPDRT